MDKERRKVKFEKKNIFYFGIKKNFISLQSLKKENQRIA